jgi:hypothetical protein
MATDKPKVLLILDEDLLKRIDDYRYENRIPARTEAIRRLIETHSIPPNGTGWYTQKWSIKSRPCENCNNLSALIA